MLVQCAAVSHFASACKSNSCKGSHLALHPLQKKTPPLLLGAEICQCCLGFKGSLGCSHTAGLVPSELNIHRK